ncbi:neck passage structure [Lactococcus phage 57001]|uniref:Neck passage structure n=1 Tax=Lactococcus phage 57001 TaxID=2029667 RepID=A0A343JPS6_9CAUD|nr:virion structural protein [Lactococcus phage 57001]ASZ71499.1 neck passage structure [Lactococcus phage 57001]
MSLDNFRNRTIIWDTVNKDFPQPIQIMQGDVNARTLLIKIVDNGVEIDLTGHSLKLAYQYTNSSNSGFVMIPPKDLAKGEFILVIPTEMTTTGVIEANLILLNESLEQVIVSKSLTFISDNSTVTDLAQEVNNKIDDFTKLLLENMPQVMRSELNDLHAQTEANLSDIEALQDSIAKIAEAQANSLPLNVKWFGAKGDGVTDDTLSIQRAIDTGFSVFIPPGKYNVKELKGFSSGQIIQGISKAESWGGKNTQNITLLNGIGSADNYVIKNNVWTDGILPTAITVKNLSIEGSKKTNGILVGNSSTIEGVKIANCINGLSNIKVSNVMNCQINGCTNGVMSAVDSKITNNFFYYNEVGINFDNSNDNSIVNNKIEWNRIGISLTKATFNLISNNIIDRNTTYGIYTFNTANTTILGNQFERNLTNHLYLQGSQFNISTNSFFRKNSEDNQSGIMAPDIAIFVKSVSNSMITNNFVNGKMFNKTGTDYSSNVNYSANTIDGINPDNISINIPETTVAHDQDTKIIIPLPSYFDGALNNPYNVEIVSQKMLITTQDGNFYSNGGIIKSIYMSKSGIELTIINHYKDDLKIAGKIKVRCVYPSLY